mgnify:CR=1 FL=1
MFTRLKQLRESHNLTQNDISKFLKITSPQYSLYETGKREFKQKHIKKILTIDYSFILYLIRQLKPRKNDKNT